MNRRSDHGRELYCGSVELVVRASWSRNAASSAAVQTAASPAPAGRLALWLSKSLEFNLFGCALKSEAPTVAESLPI